MEKSLLIAMLVVSIVLVGTLGFALAENPKEETFQRSFTKAICTEENYCEDYEVICEGDKILNLNPTGFAVQFPEEWNDPRNKENIEIKC